MMVQIIMNIILGLIPETLYFTMFLIYTKDIKERKFTLFILISLAYLVLISLSSYKMLYYLSFVFVIYIILKILYKDKSQKIDIFIISFAFIYVSLLSYICYIFIQKNHDMFYLFYTLDRIFLFVPFLFKNKFNTFYKRYCLLWNRNNADRTVKSITLRSVSLVIINISISLGILYLLSIIN